MAGSLKTQYSGVDAYHLAKNEYISAKNSLASWASLLSGNVTLLDGLNIQLMAEAHITNLGRWAATPGLNAAAQADWGDATFDAVAAINTLVADLTSIKNWVTANLPSTTYTPTQTAPLLTLVQTAQAGLV